MTCQAINQALDSALSAIAKHFEEQSQGNATFIIPLHFDTVAIQARLIAHSYKAGLIGHSITVDGRRLYLRKATRDNLKGHLPAYVLPESYYPKNQISGTWLDEMKFLENPTSTQKKD